MRIIKLFILAFVLCLPGMAFPQDSVVAPLHVIAKNSSSGVPVGTVVAWPVSSNPSDWSNWLECNGQSISSTAYPDLYAVVGGTVPDYRGLFLRGHDPQSVHDPDGASRPVGSTQQDAGRNITGQAPLGDSIPDHSAVFDGFFYYDLSDGSSWIGSGDTDRDNPLIRVDASRVWGTAHTAEEFRPVNTAVRYIIRAKP
jgi:hypothetical protein